METNLNAGFWSARYKQGDTGWDLGEVSTPLKNYFDRLTNPSLKILIPGCGNAWEASYLHQQGFKEVYLIDLAEEPLIDFKNRNPDFPEEHLICGDFFEHEGHYDLIVEQTFFCAIDPSLRPAYVQKMHHLLVPGGKLAGLLFNCVFEKEGPPFGGSEAEYRGYFEDLFKEVNLVTATDSIQPRAGRELFIEVTR